MTKPSKAQLLGLFLLTSALTHAQEQALTQPISHEIPELIRSFFPENSFYQKPQKRFSQGLFLSTNENQKTFVLDHDDLKPIHSKLNDNQKRCLELMNYGSAECPKIHETYDDFLNRLLNKHHPSSDPLIAGRIFNRLYGTKLGRDLMAQLIKTFDHSKGMLETRLATVSKAPRTVYEDSIYALSASEKAKISFLVVPGLTYHIGASRVYLESLVDAFQSRGFQSVFVKTKPIASSQVNAEIIARTLKDEISKGRKVILLSASKGSRDTIEAFRLGLIDNATAAQIPMILSLSGVYRKSFFAEWGQHYPNFMVPFEKKWILWRTPEEFRDLSAFESLTIDPFKNFPEENISVLRKIPFVNIVALPEGNDGLTKKMPRLVSYQARLAAKTLPYVVGPDDGVVESGAALFPAEHGIQQHVIRVLGHHMLFPGKLMSGEEFGREAITDPLLVAHEFISLLTRSIPYQLK